MSAKGASMNHEYLQFPTYPLYTVRRTLFGVQCTAYSVRRTVYGVQYTAYSVQRTVYRPVSFPVVAQLPMLVPSRR